MPPAENVHWLFAAGILALGLCLLARAIVGEEIWEQRRWRVYLVPTVLLGIGIGMWPVTVFFTSSAIHMMAHGLWAEVMMVAGLVQLGLVAGRLQSRLWNLAVPIAVAASGAAFVIHEQNPWLFMRSAFLHHLVGWTLIVGALIPLALVFRPRSTLLGVGFGVFAVALSVMLFSDRDLAPIFGHFSPLAGEPVSASSPFEVQP
jgi:hypothetical protein